MICACVLVRCRPGKYKEVVADSKKLSHVANAYNVFGRWDVIIEIQAPSMPDVDNTTTSINTMTGVRSIETLIEKPLS
ncbi:MAG: Lrp/AsnC ligand binding domain-containing protein [Candidatus Ranarchaeia archaeon]|jgi:hypothetical protein